MLLVRYLRVSPLALRCAAVLLAAFPLGALAQSAAPAGPDGVTNGLVSQTIHKRDRREFEEVETDETGLGPIFNERSCSACHDQPVTGGFSTTTERRAGHVTGGEFVAPVFVVGSGDDQEQIEGRSVVNASGTCAAVQIATQIPAGENVQALRASLSLLGDGFVEAVPDAALFALAESQCQSTQGQICGEARLVPVLEAPGVMRVGRFGWKAQHASLLSFSADAYLDEMGITSRLLPEEVTQVCDIAEDPEDVPSPADLHRPSADFADIDIFARFIRATRAPARGRSSAASRRGSARFDSTGCSTCHVRSLTTAPTGTPLNGGKFVVPKALGNKLIHPFGDFLLHDVGTGDGIVQASGAGAQATASKLRTVPLWGLHSRRRFMHDLASLSLADAIGRHAGEASDAAAAFAALAPAEQADLIAFLRSL